MIAGSLCAESDRVRTRGKPHHAAVGDDRRRTHRPQCGRVRCHCTSATVATTSSRSAGPSTGINSRRPAPFYVGGFDEDGTPG